MKAKVFLVEDDQSIVSLVQYNLQKEGFNVQTSGNGEEAIKDIEKIIKEIKVKLRKNESLMMWLFNYCNFYTKYKYFLKVKEC